MGNGNRAIVKLAPVAKVVDLFPAAVADPLADNSKLQDALDKAISAREALHSLTLGSMPVRFAFADVSNDAGPFPFAEHLENVMDFTASEAKVAVMYAAYVLRDMARRFAQANGITKDSDLFSKLTTTMNMLIRTAVPRITSAKNITDMHRLPVYQKMLTISPSGAGSSKVNFTKSFDTALENMIIPSSNDAAAACVHGVGYSYLNGALAAGGFFNTGAGSGLWVAGDYTGKYPYVRINSVNDGPTAQNGTTRDMVRLVSLLATKRLLQPADCDEMLGRLSRAASGVLGLPWDQPWAARPGILKPGCITHNKLGLGPLKSGQNVRSEVSILSEPVATGRKYVAAWQNLVGLKSLKSGNLDFDDIATIIQDTITEYEKP